MSTRFRSRMARGLISLKGLPVARRRYFSLYINSTFDVEENEIGFGKKRKSTKMKELINQLDRIASFEANYAEMDHYWDKGNDDEFGALLVWIETYDRIVSSAPEEVRTELIRIRNKRVLEGWDLFGDRNVSPLIP